jgi:RNA polymerase sigma-70 factor (ECF subfamily)
MPEQPQPLTVFEGLRGRLFGLAYRMLGSRAEAEDVVQDTYLRWHQADRAAIENPEAWLVTAATRRAIDRLRGLKTEREAYQGPWLPEPLMNEAAPPDRHAQIASDLSIAFLALLERLAPDERAAFLLHDVFDCDYRHVARTLDRSEAACRQMVHRARERVGRDRKRFDVSEAQRAGIVRQFAAAVEARDEAALTALFVPDATWTADGGGRVPASPRAITGAARIVKLILGLTRQLARDGATLHVVAVNGEVGLCTRAGGRVRSVLAFETDDTRIVAVNVVVNPDKLGPASAAH